MSDYPTINSITPAPISSEEGATSDNLSVLATVSLAVSSISTLLGILLVSVESVGVWAFYIAFLGGLTGIITGHLAQRQIKRGLASGRGFALVGTILGYISAIGMFVLAVLAIGLILLIAAAFSQG